MSKKDALYDLIQSLVNNEKRYFKLFSERHTIGEKNNYVKLFEVLAKQKEYDGDELKRAFAGTSIGRNLRVNKHYLYQLILKSLNSFHCNSSVNARLSEMVRSIEILLEKGLHEQARKIATKAENLATKYENYAVLLQILRCQLKIDVVQYNNMGKVENHSNRKYEKIFHTIDRLRDLTEYDRLTLNLIPIIIKYGKQRNSKKIKILSSEIKQPLLANPDKTSSSFLFSVYKYKYYYYQYLILDKYRAYFYSKMLVKVGESNAHMLEQDPVNFSANYLHFILSQLYLKKFNEMPASLSKLRELVLKIKVEKKRNIFLGLAAEYELSMFNHQGQFEKSISLIKKYDYLFYQDGMLYNFSSYLAMAYAYMGMGDYRLSIRYLSKIINAVSNYRNDIQCVARILNLIAHFEAGNMELLEYAVKSAYRFLLKKEKLHRYEMLLLTFIQKKFPKMNTESEAISVFKELKLKLEQLTKQYPEEDIETIDVIAWLESKIEKRPFADVLKEKAKQTNKRV